MVLIEKEQIFLVALGGNLSSGVGPPEVTLRQALRRFEHFGLNVDSVSRFYKTPCFPAGAGPDYVNAAVKLRAHRTPEQVLAALHAIEAEFGRERVQRWGMRSLDLDLLATGDAVLPDLDSYLQWQNLPLDEQKKQAPEVLVLPHPRLSERGFVLVPLADIAPDWRHPVLGQTVIGMLKALPEAEKQAVKPL